MESMFHAYTNMGEFLWFYSSFNYSFIKSITFIVKGAATQLVKYKKNTPTSLWHQLPEDIMEIIVRQLALSDRFVMSMACKSWRTIFLNRKKLIINGGEFPWLVLPHGQGPAGIDNRLVLSFYSIEEGRVFNLELPKKARGGFCCGSSRGWLGITKGSDIEPQFFLWNPLSRALLELPSLTTMPCFQEFIKSTPTIFNKVVKFLNKFDVSSANRSSAQPLTVAVLCNYKGTLAFCRLGDKTWRTIEETGDNAILHTDILFSNDILYTLDMLTKPNLRMQDDEDDEDDDDVEEEDEEEDDFGLIIKPITYVLKWDKPGSYEVQRGGFLIAKHGTATCYLVESPEGELMMIQHNVDLLYEDQETQKLFYHKTSGFGIHKVDVNSSEMMMHRLTSWGDQMIFYSQNGSLSVPTWKYDHEFHQGNCIYFIADPYDGGECIPKVSREGGVFYLGDGTIKRHIPSFKLPMQSRPCWLKPNF